MHFLITESGHSSSVVHITQDVKEKVSGICHPKMFAIYPVQ